MRTAPSDDALINQLAAHYRQLQQANAQLRAWERRYLDDLRAQLAARLDELQRADAAAAATAAAQRQATLAQADAALAQAVQQTAAAWSAQAETARQRFGWVIAPWDDPAWTRYAPDEEGALPAGVRIGALRLRGTAGEFVMPAVAPLLGHRHLFVVHDSATRAAAQALLQGLLLRLVLTFPPRTAQFVLLEPGGAGETLSAFLHLPASLRGAKVYARPDEIGAQLAQLNEQIEAVVQTRLRNVYANVEEYNAANPANAAPYRIVALAGLPVGGDERQWQALLQIAAGGPRAGIYLVAALDANSPPPRGARSSDLPAHGVTLTWQDADTLAWEDPDFGRYTVYPDKLPPAAQMNGWLEAVGEAAEQRQTELPFRQIATPPGRYWQGDTRRELAAVVGVDSAGKPYTFRFNSTGSEIVAHGLIGGAPGAGKSNFLHVLIMQLALAYSPEEVELYLIDFREGVEFQDYAHLPHARVLAVESEREFALSILARLAQEIERRGELFKAVQANSPEEYRRRSGAPLPRVLLIIDEFQRLFEPDDNLARAAGGLLENLTRIARGFGIHVLLSSQSPSTLALQSHRLYDQMLLRLAFRCTENVSAAILGAGNSAAAQLAQSGEAILNDKLGDRSANRQLRIAHFPSEERRHYLAAIAQLASGSPASGSPAARPITFSPRLPARLAANAALQAALAASGSAPPLTPVRLWLGEPIALKEPTAAVLQRQEQSNLLVVGRDEEAAIGLLLAGVLSLAAQYGPQQARFVLADFADPIATWHGLCPQLAAALPHAVEVFTPTSDLFAALDAPAPRTKRSLFGDDEPAAAAPALGPLDAAEQLVQRRLQSFDWVNAPGEISHLYFVVTGLHLWSDLVSGRDMTPLARQLLFLARSGPKVGVHLLAWVDRPGYVDQMLRGALKLFDWRVALRMDEDDSRLLLDNLLGARLGDQRALLRNGRRAADDLEKFKPYPLPPADALDALTAQVRAKYQGDPHGRTTG